MTKRLAIAALVMAAALVLAAPTLAFDGNRSDYTLTLGSGGCEACHAGPYFDLYLDTAHAMIGTATVTEDPPGTWELSGTANAEPIADGPGCAGCHSGNYDPKKHVEDPVTGFYPWENTAGDDAFSEPFVGCSACHRGLPTAHNVPKANMANADICGQCHSRYSSSKVAYENNDGTFSARQYTLGSLFNPLGTSPAWAPAPITDAMNIAAPGVDWPVTVPPTAPSMIFYGYDGEVQPWSARGHEEGAAQYSEWALEGHAEALVDLKANSHAEDSCLECHSADYILAEEGEEPTLAEAKHAVTCQVCHSPHVQSEQTSLWNEERNPQLTAPREELCVGCHTAEIPAGETASPGSQVHNNMKEIMEGRGAIGVPQGSPSVHKDRCVNCHMVPTQYDRNGVPQTGANHVFAIVEPEVAAESLTTANIAGEKRPMPYSSCGECHGRSSDPYATYLTGTFENRQAQMQAWDAEVGQELTDAAKRLGYGSVSSARTALNAKGEDAWNASELAFMSAYTNRTFIESEGSWGIHNWDYARTVILKAQEQARSVKWAVVDVTIGSPLVSAPYGTGVLKFGQSTTISGKIVLPAGASTGTLLGGQVRLWFKPDAGGSFQPIQQVFLSGTAFDEYLFTVMPARNGTYIAEFVGNDTWSGKVSMQNIGLDVAWRVTLTRNALNIRLNKILRLRGGVTPLDFDAGSTVMIQRKKGTGAWKNWLRLPVETNGTFSRNQKMTKTGTWYFRAVFAADADHLQGTSNKVKVVVKR